MSWDDSYLLLPGRLFEAKVAKGCCVINMTSRMAFLLKVRFTELLTAVETITAQQCKKLLLVHVDDNNALVFKVQDLRTKTAVKSRRCKVDTNAINTAVTNLLHGLVVVPVHKFVHNK